MVRRLDQHEAWGTARSSPNKHARSGSGGEGAGAGGKQGLADSGTGFSLFSPVKKQRVPLFNETSTIRVGATPSKPDAPGGLFLVVGWLIRKCAQQSMEHRRNDMMEFLLLVTWVECESIHLCVKKSTLFVLVHPLSLLVPLLFVVQMPTSCCPLPL